MREYFQNKKLSIDGRNIPYPVVNSVDYLVCCHSFTQKQAELFGEIRPDTVLLISQIIAIKQACFLLRHTTHSCESLPDSLLSLKKKLIAELKEKHNFLFDEAWIESLI